MSYRGPYVKSLSLSLSQLLHARLPHPNGSNHNLQLDNHSSSGRNCVFLVHPHLYSNPRASLLFVRIALDNGSDGPQTLRGSRSSRQQPECNPACRMRRHQQHITNTTDPDPDTANKTILGPQPPTTKLPWPCPSHSPGALRPLCRLRPHLPRRPPARRSVSSPSISHHLVSCPTKLITLLIFPQT